MKAFFVSFSKNILACVLFFLIYYSIICIYFYFFATKDAKY